MGTPVNLLSSSQSVRAYLFPQSDKIYYFCAAAPLVLTPFVRNQDSSHGSQALPHVPHAASGVAAARGHDAAALFAQVPRGRSPDWVLQP